MSPPGQPARDWSWGPDANDSLARCYRIYCTYIKYLCEAKVAHVTGGEGEDGDHAAERDVGMDHDGQGRGARGGGRGAQT